MNVGEFYHGYDFLITGASYAGYPRNNTMMYISKKVGHLIENLYDFEQCLVFVEKGISVPDEIKEKNCVVECDNPQYEYVRIAGVYYKMKCEEEKKLSYILTDDGYYIGDNVNIGDNSYIEPGCLIGHNVTIGNNATILFGSVIKHSIIGDNFMCNENAVIGNFSFTMAEDTEGNKIRIPALGRVIIGDNVEVGACNDIACGACGDTVLEDYVKLDSLIHIGHEAVLRKNTEVTAGVIVAGFAEIDEHSYLGINSSIKNRIHLGRNCYVGMGTNVTRDVEPEITVVGNPARPLQKRG